MIKIAQPLIFLGHQRLLIYFVSFFVHLLVLMSLIAHQFLFTSFIDPNLSTFGYSLCFFILFFDSLFLFFYDEGKRNFELVLLFLSALFLVFLNILMGSLSFLFFIFFLVFLQFFPLLFFGKFFLSSVFLLCLSILFPISFLWIGAGNFEDRLSLFILTNFVLFSFFIFGLLFVYILNSLEFKRSVELDSEDSALQPSYDLLLSLGFSRKLKPALNSLLKYFPEKESDSAVLSRVFSPQKGKLELQKLKQFILDFIDFAEFDGKTAEQKSLDLKKLLNEVMEELKTHKQKPDNLTWDIECSDFLKITSSSSHLKKCFRNILINSFEALKNEKEPTIKIYCFRQRNKLSIQFLDNGHGIEEEDKKRLFDPLFSKRFGLRGLGLSYVQKIVQALNGEVSIQIENKWTKVILSFPLSSNYYDQFNFLKLLKRRKKVA